MSRGSRLPEVGLRRIAAFALGCALSACHSTPALDRKHPPAPQGPPVSQGAPAQAASEPAVEPSVKVPIELPIDTSMEAPIVAPPCVPLPQPKHAAASKPEPPPPAASPAAPAGAPAAGSATKAMPLKGVESVLGRKVQGEQGEDLGRVVDVLADEGGHVRAAVIEFGGFLGVGNRRIAVDWSLLRFHPEDRDKALTLGVSVKTLQSVPEYKNSDRGPQALMAQPPAATQVPATPPAPSAEGKK